MTFPADPHDRSPKGDHNRRLALGLEIEELAFHAGISVDELRDYEFTPPDHEFDPLIADRVGIALERLESVIEPKVDNGGVPGEPRLRRFTVRSDQPSSCASPMSSPPGPRT